MSRSRAASQLSPVEVAKAQALAVEWEKLYRQTAWGIEGELKVLHSKRVKLRAASVKPGFRCTRILRRRSSTSQAGTGEFHDTLLGSDECRRYNQGRPSLTWQSCLRRIRM
jgi:hypothetical protein